MSRADPIVDEVHKAREAIAEGAKYDLDRIIDEARIRQAQSGRQVVSRPPKRIIAKKAS